MYWATEKSAIDSRNEGVQRGRERTGVDIKHACILALLLTAARGHNVLLY